MVGSQEDLLFIRNTNIRHADWGRHCPPLSLVFTTLPLALGEEKSCLKRARALRPWPRAYRVSADERKACEFQWEFSIAKGIRLFSLILLSALLEDINQTFCWNGLRFYFLFVNHPPEFWPKCQQQIKTIDQGLRIE